MPSLYPPTHFVGRAIENMDGVVYDANRLTVIYAEDFLAIADELDAIETELDLKSHSADPVLTGVANITSDVGAGYQATLYRNTAGSAPVNSFRRARGTEAVPLQTQSGDVLGGQFFRGMDETLGWGSVNPCAIRCVAAENVTTMGKGCYVEIHTTPIGSTTRGVALVVGDDKSLTIGISKGVGTGGLYAGAGTFTGGLTSTTLALTGAMTTTSTITSHSSSSPLIQNVYSNSTGNIAGIFCNRYGGTVSVPTKTLNNSALGAIYCKGYEEVNGLLTSQYIASVRAIAIEDFTNTAQGTAWIFTVCTAGTTTLASRLRIDSTGITVGSVAGTPLGGVWATTGRFTDTVTITGGKKLQSSTGPGRNYIDLDSSGNTTIMSVGTVTHTSNASVIINIDYNNDGTSSELVVRSNGSASSLFSISETGGVVATCYATTERHGLYVVADSITTKDAGRISSNSADASARSILTLINDNTAAVGVTILNIQQDALISTHFQKIANFGGSVLWRSDGTDPNGALSGTAGDVCMNGATNKPAYCTGTTVWVNLV